MNVYVASIADSFGVWSGENGATKWETSRAKRVFDLCQQVGLKVLFTDDWLLQVSNISEEYWPDDKFNSTYGDDAALANTVKTKMAPYIDHPAFYGVILTDEPRDTSSAERFGRLYKAIQTAYPGTYVHSNLLPGMDNEYYSAYIDAMGSDYVMFDQYPLYTTHIYRQYIADIQRIAELCKDKGVDMQVVTQTAKMISGTVPNRDLDEKDLYWLNNMLVGFGVKEIYYYTYYTRTNTTDEQYADGYSFIDNNGEKTHVYDAMQKITAEMQLLAPYILHYDYNASAVYQGNELSLDVCKHTHYSGIVNGSFQKISGVSVDNDRALVTELTNGAGGYMYMVQNVADPECACAGTRTQKATITFSSDVKTITVFTNGVPEKVTLTGNTYTVTQTAGQAVYIAV